MFTTGYIIFDHIIQIVIKITNNMNEFMLFLKKQDYQNIFTSH